MPATGRQGTAAAADEAGDRGSGRATGRALSIDHARRRGACRRRLGTRTENTAGDGHGVRRANLYADRLGRLSRTSPHPGLCARRRTGKRLGSRHSPRRCVRPLRSTLLRGCAPPRRTACRLRRRNLDRARQRVGLAGSDQWRISGSTAPRWSRGGRTTHTSRSLKQQAVPATCIVTKAYWAPGKVGLD